MTTGWSARLRLICLITLLATLFTGISRAEAPSPTSSGVQQETDGRTQAGTVEFVEGDVRLIDAAKQPRRVQSGDPVFEKDSIVTGKDGELHLNMLDGGLIAVRPNTRMRIAQFRAQGDEDDKGIFGLLAGSFRAVTGWIGKYNRQSYLIRTPTAAIGVRGTDHEPLVIPPNSEEGEPGTYDKVNAGESYIRTPHGSVDIGPGKSAFAPRAPKPGQEAPRLLAEIPRFYRPTRNEFRIDKRHDEIQQHLDRLREDRRKHVAEHRPSGREADKEERQGEAKERRQHSDEQKQRRSERAEARGGHPHRAKRKE